VKTLLTTIQALIRGIDGIGDADVFISADKGLTPRGARFPCIGIKDGQVERSFLMGDRTELTLPVEIYIYQQLKVSDKEILDVFDIASQVHALLQDNYLDGYVKDVEPGRETPVQLLYQDTGMVMRKTLFYQYNREE
jgi:hypothetical protein